MSKVITHPLLVRPSSATRSLIGVVPNQLAAAYNASCCQVRMSNVKTRPLMSTLQKDPLIEIAAKNARNAKQEEEPDLLLTLFKNLFLAPLRLGVRFFCCDVA
jgi:hypothetical protein